MSDEKRELAEFSPAPAQPAQGTTQALLKVLTTDTVPFFCSFDLNTQLGRKQLFRCDEPFDFEIKHQVKQTFEMVHVFATPVEILDKQTGELKPLTKIILMDPDGKTHGCFSKGVKGTIALLVGAYGMPPWNPPLKVEVYAVPTKHEGDMLKLRVIEPEEKKGGKPK